MEVFISPMGFEVVESLIGNCCGAMSLNAGCRQHVTISLSLQKSAVRARLLSLLSVEVDIRLVPGKELDLLNGLFSELLLEREAPDVSTVCWQSDKFV